MTGSKSNLGLKENGEIYTCIMGLSYLKSRYILTCYFLFNSRCADRDIMLLICVIQILAIALFRSLLSTEVP